MATVDWWQSGFVKLFLLEAKANDHGDKAGGLHIPGFSVHQNHRSLPIDLAPETPASSLIQKVCALQNPALFTRRSLPYHRVPHP